MFTYKNAPYKIFALGPKFCCAGPVVLLTLSNRCYNISPDEIYNEFVTVRDILVMLPERHSIVHTIVERHIVCLC